MKIAILTSKGSSFMPFATKLLEEIRSRNKETKLFTDHKEIDDHFDTVFILSYFKLIPEIYLQKRKHNLVVHGSNLPQGKGWSPVFWQIIEGKNTIPFTLFEAVSEMDAGDYYIKDSITLEGHELHEEIRTAQNTKVIEMCLQFIDTYENLKPIAQTGQSTFYKKRTLQESQLDPHKTIQEQFNLLRTVHNTDFPAYFYAEGKKYVITIHKENNENI